MLETSTTICFTGSKSEVKEEDPLSILKSEQLDISSDEPRFSCMNKDAPEMYVCKLCGVKVYLKVNLKVHEEIMHKFGSGITIEEFCALSDINYNFTSILKQHICKNCNFQTSSLLIYLKHIINHPKCPNVPPKKPIFWKCNYDNCHYKTRHEKYLARHAHAKHVMSTTCQRADYKEIQVFQCKLCSYRGKSKRHLESHVVSRHTAPEDIKWFKCDHCPYKAKQKCTLKGHVLARHTASEKINWFACEKCSFKFKRKTQLRQHMLSHSENKLMLCEICSAQFKRLENLKQHVRHKHKTKM